jgi:hypothetical protein
MLAIAKFAPMKMRSHLEWHLILARIVPEFWRTLPTLPLIHYLAKNTMQQNTRNANKKRRNRPRRMAQSYTREDATPEHIRNYIIAESVADARNQFCKRADGIL